MGRGAAAAAAPRSAPGRHRSARDHSGSAPASSPARGRRRSGHATRVDAQGAASVALPLPVRIFNAPFSRTARARTNGVLDALLTGRGWIALVFLLLAGIVFFNVDLLQMNRDIAQNAERISTLKRENARLLLEEARLTNSERVQEEAVALGLVLPAPGQVRYLKARPSVDARRASRGMSTPSGAYAPPGTDTPGDTSAGDTETGSTGATLDPATGLPIDPATGTTTYDPVTGAAIDPSTGQPYDPAAADLGAADGTADSGATANGAATGATPPSGTVSGTTITDPATGAPAG